MIETNKYFRYDNTSFWFIFNPKDPNHHLHSFKYHELNIISLN